MSDTESLYEVELRGLLAAIKYAEGFDRALGENGGMCWVHSGEFTVHMDGDQEVGTVWFDTVHEQWRVRLPKRGEA